MRRQKMPKSIRKFIRKAKARIRREVLSPQEQGKQIQALYEKLSREKENYESK